MPKAIHQFTAGFKQGDAISNEAVAMKAMFGRWGYESSIFCDHRTVQKEVRDQIGEIQTYRKVARPDDLVILHLSCGSIANEIFAELPCRKAVMYHNVTPPEFFIGVQDRVYSSQAEGIEQVKGLSDVADLNMAVSGYNARQLEEMGYRDVKVLPLILELDRLRKPIGSWADVQFGDGLVNVLFVGRIAGNKKIEDALKAFHYFQKYVEPRSRFIHVGYGGVADKYFALLRAMTADLKLDNVMFAGGVEQKDLNGCYRAAHMFLCMSEHEGFCIPLIEAMVHDLPVMAYAAAAVPDTMDGAGILFHEKRFDLIAEMMGRVAHDQQLRQGIIQKQRDRLARYEARDLEAELKDLLQPLL